MSDPAPKAVFLSYARDDAAAARRIAEALRSSGVEVWFDENELRGGDKWDAKIRRQINDCALFMPLISQVTNDREKGYFRLEWKLAVEQTHLLAAGVPFIAPVAIDDTKEDGAVVPPEFLQVQWTRLPGALPTPQFVAHTKHLLHAPHQPAGVARIASSPAVAAGRSSAFPLRTAGVIATLVIVAAYFALRPAQIGSGASPATSPVKSAATGSESQQLVVKARALYEPWDFATRGDFDLAEQLLKKAVELDPTNGEAWAAYSLLSGGFIVFSYDASTARRQAARTQADRALKLAPDSDLARFANAFSFRFNRTTQEESLRLLQIEVGRQPKSKTIIRTLGNGLRSMGRNDQALVYYDKGAALPGGDPIALYCKALSLMSLARFAEAEITIDEVLIQAPTYSRARTLKITILVDQHGDLPRALAELAKFPASLLTEDVVAGVAGRLWLWSREPEKCLEALRVARDYLEAGYFTGPKGYLTGLADQMAKRPEAARSDWQSALRVIEQRQLAEPDSTTLIYWKALLSGLLGDRPETERLLQLLRQKASGGDAMPTLGEVRILIALGRNDEAIANLSFLADGNLGTAGRNSLRYETAFDPLRGNPRFEELLKVPEAKK